MKLTIIEVSVERTTYTCAACQKTFKKGWTDQEAMEEMKNTFHGYRLEDCVLVCDDCYHELMSHISEVIETN